ncbi:MAG: phenylalanine--tRNA ligase subunit alpha [Candidatus Omnitrophica bacterium]|nr:phenylalanine--tRNA ligase subunit alpha [Candidatus Omnitrophota bacterium]MBU0878980.1 phenylalanine--tRNA ligase subunit alpha [Candidatus Omnitrophota bacterium]MBU1810529.1 phenylalanine--tRNA ligase subunit alpha [Candidatus Omnitrophota bacterium]
MEEKIKSLEKAFEEDCQKAATPKEFEFLRIKYLGRSSRLSQFFSQLPNLIPQERGIWGKRLNCLKQKMTALLANEARGPLKDEENFDLTFPSSPFQLGSRHILTTVNQKICSIFENLGFAVAEGGEIEDEWHNFTALNIPLEHPSRDVFDTFYLDIKEKNNGKYLLRSHTSPSQTRIMKIGKPPLAVISPGRVYRPDEVDATHSFMFHQIEGFAVGEDLNFAHLKGVLLHFAHKFFTPEITLRFRPHFFPFTEPSAEVDISCFVCRRKKEKGASRDTLHASRKCSVCKGKGWLEVLGCGMIHPQVLDNCEIDSKKYKGFAFGMGVERIAMLKYGIGDIRLFYENDVRFLEQFSI